MSDKHPIVAVTGSAGAGTSTVRRVFNEIFLRQGLRAEFVKGNSFFRHDEHEMDKVIAASIKAGKPISLFGPEANHFDKLEKLFADYAKNGSGEVREYIHNTRDAALHKQKIGTFTPWRKIKSGASDLLLYEGMHGGVAAHTWTRRSSNAPPHPTQGRDRRGKGNGVNAAQHVDLLIGIAPAVNLEWIQKIHRDCSRGFCSAEESAATILRRMRDYTYFIVPQFGLTDINFQRMPLVDTSNPFIARDIPSEDESILIIHFRDPQKFDFPSLLKRIRGSFMSRRNTLVAPGGKMRLALDVICTPLIQEMMEKKAQKGRK